MAYTALPMTDVNNWDLEYKDKAEELEKERDPLARQRLQAELRELGEQIEARIVLDMGKVEDYHAEHAGNVKAWQAQAVKLGKTAQALAAGYKKNPKRTEAVPQIKRILTELAEIDRAITDDATLMGAAWFDYRQGVATHLPEEYLARFKVMRSTTMNAGKAVQVRQQQVVTIRREVKALLAITDKVKLKVAIKANTGTDRPIQEARRLATELAARELKLLNELRDPPQGQAKPLSLRNGAPKIEDLVEEGKQLSALDMTNWRGAVANGASAAGLMVNRLAGMQKILDSTKKGLRSAELKDATVQTQLAAAVKHITDAKQDVKVGQGYLKRMKAALAKLESRYKAQQRKK